MCLTLLSPVVSNGHTSQCSRPYWTCLTLSRLFNFFDIQALWRTGLSARVPECQKIKNGGLDQYGTERFGRLTSATIRKSVELKGLTDLQQITYIILTVNSSFRTNRIQHTVPD